MIEVDISSDAESDIETGKKFYESKETGLGNYIEKSARFFLIGSIIEWIPLHN